MSRYTKTKLARIDAKISGDAQSKFQVRAGNVILSSKDAAAIFANHYYEPQRSRTESGKLHIDRHAVNLQNGYWQDYSQIHFAKVGKELYLINGYHRLSGLIAAGNINASFNVVVKDCNDMKEVEEFYAGFDSKTIVRHRTAKQARNAIKLHEQLGVLESVATAVYNAVPTINNGMRPITQADWDKKVTTGIFQERIADILDYKVEAKIWGKILKKAKAYIKAQLKKEYVTAVALYTLKHCDAEGFWTAVAENDGLKKGCPAKTLVDYLVGNKPRNNSEDAIKSVILAWNAHMTGRTISTLKPNQLLSIYINGTPMNGK